MRDSLKAILNASGKIHAITLSCVLERSILMVWLHVTIHTRLGIYRKLPAPACVYGMKVYILRQYTLEDFEKALGRKLLA
jgi:hypothetical protein